MAHTLVASNTLTKRDPIPKLNDISITFSADGKVATLEFLRKKTYNSFLNTTYGELAKALRFVDAQPDVVITVITGGDCRFFSSGQDLKDATSRASPTDPSDAREDSVNRLNAGPITASYALIEHKKISVVALNGPVIGWPAAWVASADIILAAESAYVYMPFMKLGISVEAAGSFSWPWRVGGGLGMDMILTCRRTTARELYNAGGIQRIFPDSEFQKGVSDFIAELSSQTAISMLEAKHIVKEPYRAAANHAIARESVFQYERGAINARSGGANAGFAQRAKELEEKKKGKL